METPQEQNGGRKDRLFHRYIFVSGAPEKRYSWWKSHVFDVIGTLFSAQSHLPFSWVFFQSVFSWQKCAAHSKETLVTRFPKNSALFSNYVLSICWRLRLMTHQSVTWCGCSNELSYMFLWLINWLPNYLYSWRFFRKTTNWVEKNRKSDILSKYQQ